MDHSILQKITTFIFDVDGVFTNSEVIVMENGDLVRTMNTRDGQALKFALEAGYNVAIMTKGFSVGVRKRFEMIGVTHIYDSLKEKSAAFEEYVAKLGLTRDEIMYMGDDIPDLVIFEKVGLATCPSDSAPENLQRADYIASKNGGQGCVREIIEKIMRVQGKWNF
jgi:3-deoxy-D-manno-octulosonate 8-phosphate phosphatase (KDO 8-P phosphatase)